MYVDKIHCYEFGQFRLDVTNNQLSKNEVPVSITQKSFEILLFLIENQGIVLKKDELLDTLWEGNFVEESTLTQHIYMLRKALKQKGEGEVFIETIPKIGYRFVAEVKEVIYENPNVHTSVSPHYPDLTESLSEPIDSGIAYFRALPEDNVNFIYDEKKKTREFGKAGFPRRRVFLIGGLLFLLIALSAGGYFLYRTGLLNSSAAVEKSDLQIKSIAVLPFRQIGQIQDEKLGLGMADVLISKLGNFEEISVRPTSAVIRFADEGQGDLFEIGRKLNVDAILIGTIQRENDLVRINVQLYRISDQQQLCSQKFDEHYSNIFKVQDRISEKIAQKLLLNTGRSGQSLVYLEYTSNTEAYQAYSMGLFHWSKRTEEGLDQALKYFKTAVEKDPKFAHAYAYLADTYTLIAYYKMKSMPPEVALANGKEIAKKALILDPDCSEALTALATAYFIENKGKEGVELLNKAIKINPNNSTARVRLAWQFVYEGDLEKAIEEMRLAQVLDPLSRTTNIALAQLLYLARRPDDAIVYSRRALEIDSNSVEARRWLADSYEQKGMYKEAVEELNKVLKVKKDDSQTILNLSRIFAKEKKINESKKLLAKALESEKTAETDYLVALDYITWGKTDEAIKLLKDYKSETNGSYPHFLHDYRLDPIRDNPEFKKILSVEENNKKEDADG
ncbi:MAG: winged helix-turn-helix domain-containing protein [Pyrinomonadaceae bacterium]